MSESPESDIKFPAKIALDTSLHNMVARMHNNNLSKELT
jgi:hypothetical protein